MPFIDEEEDEHKEVPSLTIAKEEFKGPVVDTRKQQYSTLSTFYQGEKWAVDLLVETTGRDSTVGSFSADTLATYGTYKRVKGFELVVDSTITNTQVVGEANGFDSVGGGIVYHCVVPNNGTLFIADMGNGRNVLFAMYSPVKLGIYEESPHKVEWKAIKWLDAETLAALEERTVETVYFDRENFRNNLKPLLTRKEVDSIKRLNNSYRRLINLYFKSFFNPRFSTFTLPMNGCAAYDPHLVRFIRRTISSDLHASVHKVIELDCSAGQGSEELSLYDMIAKRDYELLYSCSRHFTFENVDVYRTVPKLHSVFYSGIRKVVTATDISYSVREPFGFAGAVSPLLKAGVENPRMRSILPQLLKGGEEPAPTYGKYIKRVLCDDYYVFSKEFYEGGELSVLERLVQSRMKGEGIDLMELSDVAEYASRFDNLERFYYIPIILTLIKLAPGVL